MVYGLRFRVMVYGFRVLGSGFGFRVTVQQLQIEQFLVELAAFVSEIIPPTRDSPNIKTPSYFSY